jgi:hypothetical protein
VINEAGKTVSFSDLIDKGLERDLPNKITEAFPNLLTSGGHHPHLT